MALNSAIIYVQNNKNNANWKKVTHRLRLGRRSLADEAAWLVPVKNVSTNGQNSAKTVPLTVPLTRQKESNGLHTLSTSVRNQPAQIQATLSTSVRNQPAQIAPRDGKAQAGLGCEHKQCVKIASEITSKKTDCVWT